MIQRFQIEDLVVQDNSGVVFRALDTETNQPVALRRFFPFGPTGGGLQEDEQIAYNIAVERLAGVIHPALRAVICGGCDPVDGIPYIATEWLPGDRLKTYIDHAPLTQAEAANLLTLALEVSELLSQVLAEEAVWVETDLQAIVVGAEGTDRGFTFWISPLKWLGKNDGQHGLESIIILTQEVMGWTGKTISDQAGSGLGGWLKWLRDTAKTATLHEAREMLASSIGVKAPTPTKNLVRQPKRPVLVRKKKSSNKPFIIAAVVALIAIAGGGWGLVQWHNTTNPVPPLAVEKPAAVVPEVPKPAPSRRKNAEAEVAVTPPTSEEPTVAGESPEERANRKAAEFSAAAQAKVTAPAPKVTKKKDGETKTPDGILTPADYDQLVAQDGNPVIVEGVLADIGFSKSGATMYLQFSASPPNSETRGAIRIKGAPPDLAENQLAMLKGKTIRLHGNVKVEPAGNSQRPVIRLDNRAAIEEVK